MWFYHLVFITLDLAPGRLGLLWNISIVIHFYPKLLAISLFSLSAGTLHISCIFRAEYICCIFSSAQANGCFTLPRTEGNQVGWVSLSVLCPVTFVHLYSLASEWDYLDLLVCTPLCIIGVQASSLAIRKAKSLQNWWIRDVPQTSWFDLACLSQSLLLWGWL